MLDTLLHKWLRVPYMLHMETWGKPRNSAATILLIHGIGSSSESWQDIISKLPSGVRVMTVDLLGFGKSPRPDWVQYDAKRQARSIAATYRCKGLRRPMIVVGHSLGALVAVELAKLHPKITRSLILCSPPFYRVDAVKKTLIPRREKILLDIYKAIHKHPERFITIASKAIKYKFIDASYELADENIGSYVGALEASIVNQTAFSDVSSLTVPVHIIHGSLDPVVVRANLKHLARRNEHISLTNIVAGHEIKGKMIPVLLRKINASIANY